MQRVILAAALAVTFSLSQTSHAQQGGGGQTLGTGGAGGQVGGAGGRGAGVGTGGGTAGDSAAFTLEQAQAELARLQAEVAQLRTELENLRAAQLEGTGGAGSGEALEYMPVASATFTGRVRSVSKDAVEILDYESGQPYVLRVTEDTRATRGEQRIPVTRLREGSEVRASFDLIAGDTYATEIDVLQQSRR